MSVRSAIFQNISATTGPCQSGSSRVCSEDRFSVSSE